MSFHVGQKVVCVDAKDGIDGRYWDGDVPVEGAVYTITGFYECLEGLGFVLAEIKNTQQWRYAYNSRRFRPLITRSTETGMAILRKVADDAAKRRNLVTTL